MLLAKQFCQRNGRRIGKIFRMGELRFGNLFFELPVGLIVLKKISYFAAAEGIREDVEFVHFDRDFSFIGGGGSDRAVTHNDAAPSVVIDDAPSAVSAVAIGEGEGEASGICRVA